MEVMSLDIDGDLVHRVRHVFRMADLVGWAAHGGKIDVVVVARSAIAALDLEMRECNGSICTLVGASSIMNLGASWRLLVGVGTVATSFLEVVSFGDGGSRGTYVGLRDMDHSGDRHFVNRWVETVRLGSARETCAPNTVRGGREQSPAVVGGKLLSSSVECRARSVGESRESKEAVACGGSGGSGGSDRWGRDQGLSGLGFRNRRGSGWIRHGRG